MRDFENKQTKMSTNTRSGLGKRLSPSLTFALLLGLVVSGIVLGTRHKNHTPGSQRAAAVGLSDRSDQDSSALFSTAREAGFDVKTASNAGAGQEGQAAAAAKRSELAVQQQATEAAAQRAAQEAMLAAKQQELDQKAAEQEAREQQLEQERLRVEAEKQKAQEVAAEAEKARRQVAVIQPHPAAYSGPSSGTIVWQGNVKGTTLVTINGKSSDVGEVVLGALPGVLVMIQPADAKHVGVASTPAPSNSYQRLTLRVQGSGMLQETIRWSIP